MKKMGSTLLAAFFGAGALALVSPLCTAHAASPEPTAWIGEDDDTRRLYVGESSVRIIGETPRAVDINMDAGVICWLSSDNLWAIDLSRKTYEHAVATRSSHLLDTPPPHVAASSQGQCAIALPNNQLGIVKGTEMKIVQLQPPAPGVQIGGWQQLRYVAATKQFMIVTERAYALVSAVAPPPSARMVAPVGGAMETKWSSFACCAVLSRDGRTLYAAAGVVNDIRSRHDAIVRIDAKKGTYQGFLLPLELSFASRDKFEPYHNEIIALTRDGTGLVSSARSESPERGIAVVNLRGGGAPRWFPSDGRIAGIAASGQIIVDVRDGLSTRGVTRFVNPSNGLVERTVTGARPISVSHSSGDATVRASALSQTWRPSPKRIAQLNLGTGIVDTILHLAQSLPNSGTFVMYASGFSMTPKSTNSDDNHPTVPAAEALAYISSLAAGVDPATLPARPTDKNDAKAWQRYREACHAISQTKGDDARAVEAFCVARTVTSLMDD